MDGDVIMVCLDHCLEVHLTVQLGVGWENRGQEPPQHLLLYLHPMVQAYLASSLT